MHWPFYLVFVIDRLVLTHLWVITYQQLHGKGSCANSFMYPFSLDVWLSADGEASGKGIHQFHVLWFISCIFNQLFRASFALVWLIFMMFSAKLINRFLMHKLKHQIHTRHSTLGIVGFYRLLCNPSHFEKFHGNKVSIGSFVKLSWNLIGPSFFCDFIWEFNYIKVSIFGSVFDLTSISFLLFKAKRISPNKTNFTLSV